MKKKTNIKIIVCCHKEDSAIQWQEPFMPIHVGKALHPDLDLKMQSDDTGENISDKNESYCELTGMYWAWKNLREIDVIGICHYRRYFGFNKPSYSRYILKQELTGLEIPEKIIQKILKGRIVVANEYKFPYSTKTEYCFSHLKEDYDCLENLINTEEDIGTRYAFFKQMNFHNSYPSCNMFIMRWEDFDKYCTWLFSILERLEKRIDLYHHTSFQRRVFGFMAERLMNVWFMANNKKLIHRPILMVIDHKGTDKKINEFNRRYKHFKKSIFYKLATYFSSYPDFKYFRLLLQCHFKIKKTHSR